jgi:UDP-N-acetyl-D-mannosaminuronate dehydrogenase
VNVLLDKYWFPTVQVLTYAKGELLVKISIPPVLKQKELEIIKTIENTLKKVKIEIIEILQGFLSFFDIELYNILNMASLSYNNQRMHWTL